MMSRARHALLTLLPAGHGGRTWQCVTTCTCTFGLTVSVLRLQDAETELSMQQKIAAAEDYLRRLYIMDSSGAQAQ